MKFQTQNCKSLQYVTKLVHDNLLKGVSPPTPTHPPKSTMGYIIRGFEWALLMYLVIFSRRYTTGILQFAVQSGNLWDSPRLVS